MSLRGAAATKQLQRENHRVLLYRRSHASLQMEDRDMRNRKTIFRNAAAIMLSLVFILSSISVAFSEDVDRIINDSMEAFKKVSDYTCRLDKKVYKNGTIYSDPDIFVKFKKPTHYYFRWDEGPFKGQEVIFVSGRHNDQIVAHPGGIFQFITFHLDPIGNLAMKRNHHSLKESGMEKIMRIIENNYLLCKKTGLGKISYMGEDRIDGRDTWRIQGVFPKDDGFYAHKITLCFDKVLQLPVKITVCDESNRLIEEYIFRNLRINVGFKDRDFDPENPEYHFF